MVGHDDPCVQMVELTACFPVLQSGCEHTRHAGILQPNRAEIGPVEVVVVLEEGNRHGRSWQGRKTPTRSRPGDGWKWSAYYAIAELLKFFDHARCARAFGLGAYRRTPFLVADPFVQNQPKHSA